MYLCKSLEIILPVLSQALSKVATMWRRIGKAGKAASHYLNIWMCFSYLYSTFFLLFFLPLAVHRSNFLICVVNCHHFGLMTWRFSSHPCSSWNVLFVQNCQSWAACGRFSCQYEVLLHFVVFFALFPIHNQAMSLLDFTILFAVNAI